MLASRPPWSENHPENGTSSLALQVAAGGCRGDSEGPRPRRTLALHVDPPCSDAHQPPGGGGNPGLSRAAQEKSLRLRKQLVPRGDPPVGFEDRGKSPPCVAALPRRRGTSVCSSTAPGLPAQGSLQAPARGTGMPGEAPGQTSFGSHHPPCVGWDPRTAPGVLGTPSQPPRKAAGGPGSEGATGRGVALCFQRHLPSDQCWARSALEARKPVPGTSRHWARRACCASSPPPSRAGATPRPWPACGRSASS